MIWANLSNGCLKFGSVKCAPKYAIPKFRHLLCNFLNVPKFMYLRQFWSLIMQIYMKVWRMPKFMYHWCWKGSHCGDGMYCCSELVQKMTILSIICNCWVNGLHDYNIILWTFNILLSISNISLKNHFNLYEIEAFCSFCSYFLINIFPRIKIKQSSKLAVAWYWTIQWHTQQLLIER